MAIDWNSLTVEELKVAQQEAQAAWERKQNVEHLKEWTVRLVTEAKNLGYTKAQVSAHLTAVVNEVYTA